MCVNVLIIIVLVVIMWSTNAGENITGSVSYGDYHLSGAAGTIRLQEDTIIVNCSGLTLGRHTLPTFQHVITASRVVTQNCSLTSTLLDELIALNITPPTTLELYNVPANATLSASIFSDLPLTKLSIRGAAMTPDALSLLPSLVELELFNVTSSPRVQNVASMERVTMRNCSLRRVPEHLLAAERLRSLDLSYNIIDYLSPHALSSSKLLTTLNLSHNALSAQTLHIHHMLALAQLDLSYNRITKFSFQELLNKESVEVDLRHNPVTELDFTEEDYKLMLNINMTLSVHVDPEPGLDCECLHGWLARALSATPRLRVRDPHCRRNMPSELRRASRESMQCTLTHCVAGCTCRTSWYTGARTLRCAALTAVPRGARTAGMRALIAHGNNITELLPDDIPDTLLILDLSKNKISHIDGATAQKLFSLKKRLVWLTDNPLACDCRNVPLFETLATYRDQVFDYKDLRCYNETGYQTLVKDVDKEELCAVEEEAEAAATSARAAGLQAAGGALAALLLAVGAMLLHARYGRRLRRWLQAVGWLHARDDSLDADSDRTYDVFVSFSHLDAELVTGELLPRLEREYRVCVHYRDWVVGEWIPTQITRSVAASKRTLVILSRNFAASQWARLEFRSALASAITDGVPRLAVIVIDDVILDHELDDDLSAYLKTNTYVKWNDPWFWQKLKTVMPRPRPGVIPPLENADDDPAIESAGQTNVGIDVEPTADDGIRL